MHQWYRINANEITDSHKMPLCNELTVHMLPLPSAEPFEINAVETIARLTLSPTHKDHPYDICTQSIYSNSTLTNNNTNNSPLNNNVHTVQQYCTSPLLSYNNLVW